MANNRKELKLSLAKALSPQEASGGFCVLAEGYSEIGEQDSRSAEGRELADLLFDNLPGGTVSAMLGRLRERYGALHNQELNPFKD